jgi:hypothetical protein
MFSITVCKEFEHISCKIGGITFSARLVIFKTGIRYMIEEIFLQAGENCIRGAV